MNAPKRSWIFSSKLLRRNRTEILLIQLLEVDEMILLSISSVNTYRVSEWSKNFMDSGTIVDKSFMMSILGYVKQKVSKTSFYHISISTKMFPLNLIGLYEAKISWFDETVWLLISGNNVQFHVGTIYEVQRNSVQIY